MSRSDIYGAILNNPGQSAPRRIALLFRLDHFDLVFDLDLRMLKMIPAGIVAMTIPASAVVPISATVIGILSWAVPPVKL